MKRTLLVDGDILVYQAAAAGETKVDWGDGEVSRDAGDLDAAYADLQRRVANLQDAAGADKAVVCVSGAGNFRLAFWPTYKGNRKEANRPLLVDALRVRVVEEGGYQRPMLEADDILGILATHPKLIPGERVIWSLDKDLKTVPGLHFDGAGVTRVTREEADRFFFMQVLTGDATDHYPGLPKVGPKKAEAILNAAEASANKPIREVAWPAIVAAYEAKGLTEADALIQARCARILRHTDYDFQKKEPILWTP